MCDDLFSGNGVKSGLIHFGVDNHNGPYITFCKPLKCTNSTFFYYNDPLAEIIDEDLEIHGKIIFPIENLSNIMIYRKKNDQEIYENIQNYISAILNLYTNICKGRNISSLKKLEDIGLNSDHIFKCLQINLNNNLKRGYMRLLESLFIDVEPY